MNQTKSSFRQYPAAMVNITNRCTLRCKHCFVYRDGNPNDRKDEMDTPMMLEKLAKLKRRHGIQAMLWMGGEPLLRPDVLQDGVDFFARNTVTTNGTLAPIELPKGDEGDAHEIITFPKYRAHSTYFRSKSGLTSGSS